jgi:hypothetical protein
MTTTAPSRTNDTVTSEERLFGVSRPMAQPTRETGIPGELQEGDLDCVAGGSFFRNCCAGSHYDKVTLFV